MANARRAKRIWANARARGNGLHGEAEIPWNVVIQEVDDQFFNLGRRLTTDQKNFLRNWVGVAADGNITLAQFCGGLHGVANEENLPVGQFLGSCVNFLGTATQAGGRELAQFWGDGKILGFMDRDQMGETLQELPIGTFVIGFPRRLQNYIAIFRYDHSEAADREEMLVKKAYNLEDLNRQSLASRLRTEDRLCLSNLFSNYVVENYGNVVPKDIAFAGGNN